MERKSFVFYKDWRDAIKDLPDDIRLELYDCIMEYAFTGKVEGLKPMVSIAFNFIKTAMDRNSEKYEGILEKRRSAGKKGGLTKKQTVANEANAKDAKQTVANEADNVNDNVNDNVSTNVDEEKESTNVDKIAVITANPSSQKFLDFQKWVSENAPYCGNPRNMTQITEKNLDKLLEKYTENEIAAVILAIENRKDKRKTYSNLYLTANNWLKNEKKQ